MNLDHFTAQMAGNAERIRTLSETPAEDLIKYMTDEEIEKEIERRNAMKGIAKGGLRPIG